MDIARQYVKKFMSESTKKVVSPKRKSMRSESAVLPTFEADEWEFNPKDMFMSGVATYYCPVKIDISEDMINSGANIMGEWLISDIAASEPAEEQMFCLTYDNYESIFGYHFGVFVDQEELMVYDYASSMEELKQKLEKDFIPYTNLDPASIPYDQFANKIASLNEEAPELAPVNEDSKMYTFSMEVPVTITVMADSEELARELLKKESEVEFDLAEVEFARGDAELRWMGLPADVVEMAEVSMFDLSK
jgi:hypothetical protein